MSNTGSSRPESVRNWLLALLKCFDGEKLPLPSSSITVVPVSVMLLLLAGRVEKCRLFQVLVSQQDILGPLLSQLKVAGFSCGTVMHGKDTVLVASLLNGT